MFCVLSWHGFLFHTIQEEHGTRMKHMSLAFCGKNDLLWYLTGEFGDKDDNKEGMLVIVNCMSSPDMHTVCLSYLCILQIAVQMESVY